MKMRQKLKFVMNAFVRHAQSVLVHASQLYSFKGRTDACMLSPEDQSGDLRESEIIL